MKAVQLLRVLVVDDEALARERIRKLLVRMGNAEIAGVADSGHAAVAAIRQLKPNLVLLDIQMPGMTGLEVIREIGPEHMPVTIFVTAYDEYATKAFDLAVQDYLLKPFDNERFSQAIQRARRLIELHESGDMAVRIRKALESFGVEIPEAGKVRAVTEYAERIAVESRGQLRAVSTSQIDYISASGVYAELHVGEKTYVIRDSMQALEKRLNPQLFFRASRSIIVQLDRIESLVRHTDGEYVVRLKGGKQLEISRNRVAQFERWIGVLDSHY